MTATSCSQSADAGPEKTVDGSGLSKSDLHSINAKDMWLSDPAGPQPTWIRYEFDKASKLHEMWVWNQNQAVESSIGFGAKSVTVEHSTDGATWLALGDFEFARAPGAEDCAHNTAVSFGGVAARYVRLTIHSNWGGIVTRYGLSEVRFFSVPAHARVPQPANGAANVSVNTDLDWYPARDATLHEVYFSSNQQAVVNGTALVTAVATSRYDLPALDFATTYYWKINEVNETASPSTWQGDLWSFSTSEYLAIDDFENYTNESPNRVFQAWIDGYGFSADDFFPAGNGCRLQIRATANGGSTFDDTAATAEQKAIKAPYWVKLERTGDEFKGSYSADGKTWTAMSWSPQTVVMQANVYIGLAVTSHSAGKPTTAKFSGVATTGTITGEWQAAVVGGRHPSNDPAPFYLAVEDSAGHVKTVTHPDETAVATDSWQPWQIPLSEFSSAGVNVAKVEKMYIGVGNRDKPKQGGAGLIYIDDIQFGWRAPPAATTAP